MSMRPKRFFTFKMNAQKRIFESHVYIGTETVKELYDKKGPKNNSHINMRTTLP